VGCQHQPEPKLIYPIRSIIRLEPLAALRLQKDPLRLLSLLGWSISYKLQALSNFICRSPCLTLKNSSYSSYRHRWCCQTRPYNVNLQGLLFLGKIPHFSYELRIKLFSAQLFHELFSKHGRCECVSLRFEYYELHLVQRRYR
jgi:hypothetical protein